MATIAHVPKSRHSNDPEAEGYEMILEISTETRDLLSRLAAASGGSEFDVIGKAVALIQVAIKARDKGKRIGIFDEYLELDREIVGF